MVKHSGPVHGTFGGLALRYKAPSGFGEFLEIRLDTEGKRRFRACAVTSRHILGQDGDWVQLLIPMAELNPDMNALRSPRSPGVQERGLGVGGGGGARVHPPRGADGRDGDGSGLAGAGRGGLPSGMKPGWEAKGWDELEVKGPGRRR